MIMKYHEISPTGALNHVVCMVVSFSPCFLVSWLTFKKKHPIKKTKCIRSSLEKKESGSGDGLSFLGLRAFLESSVAAVCSTHTG